MEVMREMEMRPKDSANGSDDGVSNGNDEVSAAVTMESKMVDDTRFNKGNSEHWWWWQQGLQRGGGNNRGQDNDDYGGGNGRGGGGNGNNANNSVAIKQRLRFSGRFKLLLMYDRCGSSFRGYNTLILLQKVVYQKVVLGFGLGFVRRAGSSLIKDQTDNVPISDMVYSNG
ncbi:hypothetical protein Ancab_021111 [Ancistrocladus abbreviatus]